jgi:hypothetical protein
MWQDRHEVFLNWAGLLAAFVLTCPAHTELCDPALQRR